MTFHIQWRRALAPAALAASVLLLSGCGTVGAIGNLEAGAGTEAGRMWDRWV